jgi:hypothetical protein
MKASRSRVGFWPVGKENSQWIGPNNYYVFLRFDPKAKSFEVFLESAEAVADSIAKGIVQEKLRGIKRMGSFEKILSRNFQLRNRILECVNKKVIFHCRADITDDFFRRNL